MLLINKFQFIYKNICYSYAKGNYSYYRGRY
jgi:hypothetical protein